MVILFSVKGEKQKWYKGKRKKIPTLNFNSEKIQNTIKI